MNQVLIIAEAGVNHNGDISIAKKMIEEAKRCGADIVKFQTFNPEQLASRNAVMAEYQKKNLGLEETQEKMLEKLSLDSKAYAELAHYCEKKEIVFLSTPFDLESIDVLDPLQDTWKIPSGEITNYPYLVRLAKTGKKIILSTGMSTISEVGEAVDVLRSNGAGEITLLHCTTNYPTSMKDVNLKAMLTLRDTFHCPVGYSDHTEGITVPVAAVAMGAKVIEKHFTLDRFMAGPDHRASLEPDELKRMVDSIRDIEEALGDGIKKPSESEIKNIAIVRKSIIASKNIVKGEILTEDNITTKRPGTGISPMEWERVIGTAAIKGFEEDEMIEI